MPTQYPPGVTPPMPGPGLRSVFTSGRIAPSLAVEALAGLLVAVGVVMPWATLGPSSANGFDADQGGLPLAIVGIALGLAILAIGVLRIAIATLPPALDLLGAGAGVLVLVYAVSKYMDPLTNVLKIGASLGIGFMLMCVGAVLAIGAGVFPTLTEARRRGGPGA